MQYHFKIDWEQRKLEQISDKVTEKNKQEIFKEVLTNSAEFGIVSQESYFDKKIANVKNISGYYIVRPNDFVYNPRISNFAPVGPIKRNTLFITGIMSPLYYVFRTKNISTTYLQKYFESTYWHRFMYMNGDSGARSDRFAIKDATFKEMPIPYPVFEEQKSIANFISQLDEIITLHQHKVNILKAQKKAYHNVIFPKRYQSIPLLRFNSFEGEWEHLKLGEVSDIVGGGTPSTNNPDYWNGDINWYSPAELNGDIYVNESKRKITKLGLTRSSAKMLPKGTVLFTSRAGIGKTAILDKESTTNQGFQSIVPNVDLLDTYFIYSMTHLLKRYAEINGAGSTFIEVSGKEMAQMPLRLPEINEQIKVGTLFKRFDEQINLHQRKINASNKLKKIYLRKMFL